MQKNKLNKKDILYSTVLTVAFIVFVLIILRFKFSYGSTLDWESQHSTIPEYFRLLFYETHDLTPDFAFNLGSGQNIYNFAYYGLLSPIVFISYLLPFIEMSDYVAISSIAMVIISSLLFYFWLRRNQGASPFTSFLASFALMFASSISFHSHRHVMFMNYMPFMILGLYGVDKRLDHGKGWLLSLCVFAMVMTSYYYSVGGIFFLIIYGVYKWIKKTDTITFTLFFKDGFKFLIPIIIGVLASSIIILPTFHVILSGRGETFNTITWGDLLVPSLNIGYMLYNTYGIGLTAILLFAIINLLFKKKEKFFLGIVLASFLLFPFLNYILNATMYIDAKALIPALPLAVYAIYLLLEDILKKSIDYKKILVAMGIVILGVLFKREYLGYFFLDVLVLGLLWSLYLKFDKKFILAIPILLIPFVTSLATSLSDEYVERKKAHKLRGEYREVLSSITEEDDSFYRISNARTILRDVNNLYGNIDYYTSTIYSSTYNMDYNRFYYDIMDNPIQNRNRVITSPTANILFLMFSGNKYLIDNKSDYFGYEEFKKVDGYRILKNEDVFPLMYARSDIIYESEFDKLAYPERSVALLKRVVVQGDGNTDYTHSVERFDFEPDRITVDDYHVSIKDGVYELDFAENSTLLYTIPQEYRNKILFVRFKMLDSAPCSEGDTEITIDGVKNKLTCRSWKYHNQNYDFQFVLPNKNKEEFKIIFSKGKCRIKDIELYSLDYGAIKDENKSLDAFEFDREKTKGDFIYGKIDVKEDGYFVSSIPYDEGFSVYVDGAKYDYTRVNKVFLGFPIKKGHHDIKIEYRAPLKDIATLVSILGGILFISMAIIDRRAKENVQ